MVSLLLDYLRLIRFSYHVTFVVVMVAAVFFGEAPLSELIITLPLAYVSFNVFLYGGLYTINAIGDRVIDAQHPVKKNRPVASGRIGVLQAWVYAFALLTLGLSSGALLFGTYVVVLYVLFIIANLIYTYVTKHIPYIELIFNGVTYPIRVMLGIWIGHGSIPLLLLFASSILAMSIATTRRVLEIENRHESGRPTLKYYTLEELFYILRLSFLSLLLIALSDSGHEFWYLLMLFVDWGMSYGRKYLAPFRWLSKFLV